VALEKPIADYDTVRTWQSGLREQWGDEPDMAERMAVLQRFCEFTDGDPDGLIADCTRVVESGKRIRIKERRKYTEKILEFQALSSGTPREQAKLGNAVRSFFIHNGIFMQAGLHA
jgi:hypothetical protein